jgi:hypothetical protein
MLWTFWGVFSWWWSQQGFDLCFHLSSGPSEPGLGSLPNQLKPSLLARSTLMVFMVNAGAD